MRKHKSGKGHPSTEQPKLRLIPQIVSFWVGKDQLSAGEGKRQCSGRRGAAEEEVPIGKELFLENAFLSTCRNSSGR